MSPKLKQEENVLIDLSPSNNPNSLANDEKCYFLNHDKSQSAGNVSTNGFVIIKILKLVCHRKPIVQNGMNQTHQNQ